MESDPSDLTILYTEDTVQWCEYLFDIFKDFEIQQNSEDITEFPTNQNTLQNIRDSLVSVVIISPLFLQNCTPKMQDYLQQVVGLICGVDEADMEELLRKIPSSKDWHRVEAVAGSAEISKVVLKVLHDTSDLKERQRLAEVEDTYVPVDEGRGDFIQDDYMVMVGGKAGDGRPENMYFTPDDTYEPMMPVPTSRPPAVPLGSGHVFQTTSQGYVDMKEAKHLSQCSPGLIIQPERWRSGAEGVLYMLFQDQLTKDQYTVNFQGKLKKSEVVAKQKNPYTLEVDLPKDHPAELTDVQVIGPNRAVVATCKFIFTSVMDELAEVLRDVVDPMKFMCQALGISPADANELDNNLYEHIQRCLPSGGLNLLVGQVGGEQKVLTDIPTALHFAAKYGLKNICSMLITCPGAMQAMKLKNREGFTPDVIAGKSGHNDLKCFLENFVEVAEDEAMAGEGGPSSYMFMKTGFLYYNQKELLKQLSREEGSLYDSPFQIPIPATGVPLTKEETIKKLVQGKQEDIEEYYGSLTIDMGSFQRDEDGEEDYERVEDEVGLRKRSMKKPPVESRSPRQPVEERPSPQESLPPPIEPRLAPPLPEPEGEKLERPPPRKNVKPADILGIKQIATGQQHLIEIQNRVKNKEVTVDEAVMLFKNWELLQEKDCLSFSAQAETLKALKQQKQKAKQGGLSSIFTKKLPKKGGAVGDHVGQSIFYFPRSPARVEVTALASAARSQARGSQPPLSQKPQERLIQSEFSGTNRPSSTTSLDSHGSRDSQYNSAPDEPDQEKYSPTSQPTSSIAPVMRRVHEMPVTQQDRIKRISAAYDQLSNIAPKTMPPVPSRASPAKPSSLPSSLQNLPKPSPPYGHFQPPTPSQDEQSAYLDFDDPTPGDLPELPPPPPPTELVPERPPEATCPISPSHGARYVDSSSPASKYPQVLPRQAPQKRPIPKPRTPQR
ncbi:phosphoinositide 3-kinase adapter protein 1-like isoform X2 [Acanthaster planci]|uniref:Phosphoinositide 3-kinase adapter protein 1-like isoform X2 n=1 Tax=Acanthaster planci TaxID=133434 RepID=A0A8B7ZQK3_ACAPL|nr:phosphoinositide 3-kinase adapter protein 1-like isoform X2 [Acanthaster planci]